MKIQEYFIAVMRKERERKLKEDLNEIKKVHVLSYGPLNLVTQVLLTDFFKTKKLLGYVPNYDKLVANL